MTKSKSKTLTKRRAPQRRGARGEVLTGDGSTFTALTKLPMTRIPKPLTYELSQSFTVSSWTVSATATPTFTYVSFTLSQSNMASALTDVFDQYMIDEAEVWIMPQPSVAASSNNYGILKTVIDLDDSTSLGSLTAADEYSSVVVSEATQGHYRHFIPHVALAAYSGSFTSYANRSHQWIDAASTGVQHYGVKVAIGLTGTPITYDLHIRWHAKFRSIH